MPLRGGPSAKVGHRYEYLWAVMCMIRLMRGDADSIHLEPPGHEGEGIEFSVQTSSGTEYHQVKRQLTGKGVWSLSQLGSRGVLPLFYERLGDPLAACVFVSSHAAHPLDELVSRARDSGSWEEFEQRFLDTPDWTHSFDRLHDIWSSSNKEDSYERLKRIRIVTEDEDSLRKSVDYGLETLVSGNTENARSALLEFASDQIHQVLASADIWTFLKSRHFNRQTWAHDQTVTSTISELNQTYLSGIRPVGIANEIIERNEVDQILATFDDPYSPNIVLVTGRAGVGKTSIVSQVLARLEDRDWPLLTMRVDRLEVSRTPTELGQSLGLPASPVSVLAAVAQGQDCLLILDQIDAVSQASGRNPGFFDCIAALMEQAHSHPNMRILSACRKFDIDNDPRLRGLTADERVAKEIRLEQFDEATVRAVIARMGVDSSNLSARQISLLSLPIHLRLLEETLAMSECPSLGFQTSTDLYGRFWDHKRAAIGSHIDEVRLHRIVSLLVQNMVEREALFVPLATLDKYFDDVSLLVSENILARDGERVSFFHEGFFDYIFARSFVADNLDLQSYMLERHQSLFIRSQVRQVLLYQRDAARIEFLRNVAGILTNESIRPHVKTIVLSLLSSLDDPTKDEWEIIEPLFESALSSHAWSALHGSVGWFDLLDRMEVVQHWLESSDDQLVNRTMWLLTTFQTERADRIAKLLSPYLGCSDQWNDRLANFFVRADASAGEEFLDFVLNLVHTGTLDTLIDPTKESERFWYPIRSVVDYNPGWTCKLVACYFTRLLALARQPGNPNPFPDRFKSHKTGEEIIIKAAEGDPSLFARLHTPILVGVVEANADKGNESPWHDRVWGYGGTGVKYGLENMFLQALENAICWIASNSPKEFLPYMTKFRQSEYHTIQHLLVRALAANGESFADDAVEYLFEDTEKRFAINEVSTSSDHPIQQLLDAVTPYCSIDKLACLHDAVLDYYPIWERSVYGREARGAFQLGLLEHIDHHRLSERGLRRLQELRRKFGNEMPSELVRMEGGWVGSPIPEESARRMSDDDWVRAIERHSSIAPNRDPKKFLVGGAIQLSGVLENFSKENPSRFAQLIRRIPDEANTAYFEAILRGIAGTDVDPSLVVAACLRCHRIPGRPLGRSITKLIAHITHTPLSGETLDMVLWYATQDPDPDHLHVTPNRTFLQGGKETVVYDPLTVGINSVRGTAAETVARLIFEDERYLSYFRPYLAIMATDPSDATRACVAEALLGTLRHDRDLAVELFIEFASINRGPKWLEVLRKTIRRCGTWISNVFKKPAGPSKLELDERLLATHHVESFFKFATQTHFLQLEHILLRMTKSQFEPVATAGARWICYASLTVEEATSLAKRCVSGSKWLRLGAADVYSANLRMSTHRSVCEEMLLKLFSDTESEVRRVASQCFYGFEQQELRDFKRFIEEYIRSPAFESDNNPLFDAFEKTTADIPEVILMACERVIDLAREQMGDDAMLELGLSGSIANLIVRVYGRTNDLTLRSRCLDVIDEMSMARAYGLDTAIEEFDR